MLVAAASSRIWNHCTPLTICNDEARLNSSGRSRPQRSTTASPSPSGCQARVAGGAGSIRVALV
ncbi:Uncharacterised protein [Mycobacteroides abscessus subsp. abscessus]|nr:Uncharacterised protein [Mycobacteroides abscessus subsp. abscessus]